MSFGPAGVVTMICLGATLATAACKGHREGVAPPPSPPSRAVGARDWIAAAATRPLSPSSGENTFRLELSGALGGSFVVHLGKAPYVRESREPTVCTVRLSASDYEQLLRGLVSEDDLLSKGALAVSGPGAEPSPGWQGTAVPAACVGDLLALDRAIRMLHGRITPAVRAFCAKGYACSPIGVSSDPVICETTLGHGALAAEPACSDEFERVLSCDAEHPPLCREDAIHTAEPCRGAFDAYASCMTRIRSCDRPEAHGEPDDSGVREGHCFSMLGAATVHCRKGSSAMLDCHCGDGGGPSFGIAQSDETRKAAEQCLPRVVTWAGAIRD